MVKKKEEQTTGKNIGKNMCKIEQKLQRKHLIALSFFLPLLVMTGCCIVFGVQPFGDNSLLIIDGLHQYMPFYSVLYDKLKGGETLFYSFRSGLGINFLSLFSYYLSSPFNLLILFFKKSQLNMAVSMIIVLKIACSGMTAGIYFSSKSKKQGFSIVMISMAYALSSYMVGYCWNVMWLDAIMIFPIIMMGLERLIEKKDGRLYCIALFYALYCNYYIAFMICIFAVIWYLLYSFKSIKQFFFRGIAFAFYSFLAAGMAAILLIPAYMGIKQTASGETMQLPEHSFLTSVADLLNRQFALWSPISHDNFDGNANLYIGIFSVLAVGLYVLNGEIKVSEKIKKVLLIGLFYLSFSEMILNFIWHGFHDQYGIPNRFSFLFGFVLLYMLWEVFEHLEGVKGWHAAFACMAGVALMAYAKLKGTQVLEDNVYDGTQVENAQISVDGVNVKSGDIDGYMLPIGKAAAGSEVKVTFELKGETEDGYVRLSAADFDQQAYGDLKKIVATRAFSVDRYSDRLIEGSVNAAQDQTLFFSIPYDKGWKVIIDGKEAKTHKIGDAFLGVNISSGKHKVSLKYTPPGFTVGWKITVLSAAIFLILCKIIHSRKLRQLHGK